MKVVNNRVVDFGQDEEPGGGQGARLVYGSSETDREFEHDARGLVAALLLCLGCWVALGYFLLT